MGFKDKKEIDEILKKIFMDKFQLNLNEIPGNYLEEELLGEGIGLMPRHLLFLYFEIEKCFNISIPKEVIVDGRFNNLKNIIDTIHEEVKSSI